MSQELNMAELAEKVAREAHEGQVDKSGYIPYIRHPVRVAQRFDRDTLEYVVGMLHDVVEDTPVTLSDIFAQFGSEVASAVDAISRRPEETYQNYINRVLLNDTAAAVKLADLLDNLSPERAEFMPDSLCRRYEKSLTQVINHLVERDLL